MPSNTTTTNKGVLFCHLLFIYFWSSLAYSLKNSNLSRNYRAIRSNKNDSTSDFSTAAITSSKTCLCLPERGKEGQKKEVSSPFQIFFPRLEDEASFLQRKKLLEPPKPQDSLGLLLLITQLCPALCDPMACSTPGFPVLHHLQELAQTH